MACDDLSDQFRCMFPRFRIYEAEKFFPFMSSIIGVFLIHVFLQGFVGYPETVFLFFLSFSVVGSEGFIGYPETVFWFFSVPSLYPKLNSDMVIPSQGIKF